MSANRHAMRAVLALSTSLAAFALDAAPLGGGLYGYAAADYLGPGYDFESFFAVDVIGVIDDENRVTGAFLDGDYSREYMIDSTGALFTVDTSTAEITQIGATGFAFDGHLSLFADNEGVAYVISSEEDCQDATLYVVDVNSGAAQLVGATDYCVQSAAFDASGALYQLDTADGDIVVTQNDTTTPLGPLGLDWPFNDTAAIAVDPATDGLYLFEFQSDPDPPTTMIYSVDKTTGAATVVASIGRTPLYAVALAPQAGVNLIFGGGFDF